MPHYFHSTLLSHLPPFKRYCPPGATIRTSAHFAVQTAASDEAILTKPPPAPPPPSTLQSHLLLNHPLAQLPAPRRRESDSRTLNINTLVPAISQRNHAAQYPPNSTVLKKTLVGGIFLSVAASVANKTTHTITPFHIQSTRFRT